MAAVALRKAEESDRADLRRAVAALHDAERAISETRLPGEQTADAYMEWLTMRGAFRGACLVAECNGAFAGFVAGWLEEEDTIEETPDSRRFGYISDICVLPDFRGQGVAQALLSAMERAARPTPERAGSGSACWPAMKRRARLMHARAMRPMK